MLGALRKPHTSHASFKMGEIYLSNKVIISCGFIFLKSFKRLCRANVALFACSATVICVWLKESLEEIIKPRYLILLTDSKLSSSNFHWNETGRLPLRKTTMRDFVVFSVNFHRSQYFCNSFIPLCNPVGVSLKITASSVYRSRNIFMSFTVTPAPVFLMLYSRSLT